MAKEPNKFLFYLGIIMMVVGFFIILLSLPIIYQATVSAGPITATGIPTINAIMLITGAVLIVLGLLVFLTSFKIKR